MKTQLAAVLLIGITAVGCDRPGKDRGLGAGADSAGLRDTGMAVPATPPAVTPADTMRDSTRAHSSVRDSTRRHARSQTGVTDKGMSADQRATDSLNRLVLSRITGGDTLPQPTDTLRDTTPGPRDSIPRDTVKPLPVPAPRDSARPLPDSTPPDSTRH